VGFDLQSETGEQFWFNNRGWRYVLTFAEAHGFRWPLEPDGEEKETLDAPQAAALADAIERGLGSDGSAAAADRVSAELTALLVTPSDSPVFSDAPLRFEAKTIDYWRQFIAFARLGGFEIDY
jgi:hypothetical protein